MNRHIAVLIAAAVALPAFAQTPAPTATPGIDKRQENQQRRIDKGVESGRLNEREGARLQKGQARIERMEERAREDGKVTKAERRRLQHAENVQSRHIRREGHDRQRAK